MPGRPPRCFVPELIEAIHALEVFDVALRIGQGVGRPGPGDEAEPHEVGAGQRARIVHRDISEQWHAAILDLPVANRPFRVGVIGYQRIQQKRPMRTSLQ